MHAVIGSEAAVAGASVSAFGAAPAGLGAFLRHNLDLVTLKALQMIYEGRFLTILTMFFIGAWVGRRAIYRDLSAHRDLLVRALLILGPLGVAADAALAPFQHATNAFPPTWDWVAFQTLVAVAAPALSLAYASGFALLWLVVNGRALRRLAPIGRMALTGYVSQTLVCTLAFTWLGLGARLGAVGGLAAALLIFGIQLALATVWLKGFAFGPLEWVWRCATYGQAIPLRRAHPNRRAPAIQPT